MTHTLTTTNRNRLGPLLTQFLTLILALAVLATACGSDYDDSAEDITTASESDSSASSNDAGSSAIDTTAPTAPPTQFDLDEAMDDDEEAMADEAFAVDAEESFEVEEEAATEESEDRARPGESAGAVDSEDSFAPSAEAEPPLEDDGDAEGLFADDEIEPIAPEPTPDRLEDNRFTDYGYRQFIDAGDDPLSTFALDVDTGSYTIVRRWLTEGVIPPPEAVRVEEVVNYFDYDYDVPRRGLEVTVDGGPSPFDEENILVRVGVQAEVVADNERPPVSLTFIVDTSGSMDRDDRLGLVKESLHTLVDELDDDDTVAIVIYSNDSGVLLRPTAVRDDDRIHEAIDSLRPGGSTNLESGLREGYQLAAEAFRNDGINRVIIASDGVANAGITDQIELSRFIRGYADEGIQLVTVGYGMGNFNDTLMEQLADNGDGFYAYVDSADEAERLFEDDLTSTLITAAIDAKIQVEFDPEVVADYRLIGFENRGVRDSDFRNDAVDAGELGAGHQVTAMYEIRLNRGVSLDDRGDIGEVFLRWEDPETREVIEIDEDIDLRDVDAAWADTNPDFKLATVVTAFGEVMRDNPYADDVNLANVHVEADRIAEFINDEKLEELIELLAIARSLY
ncbi:MAG: von Willebrand factor type A domain-containing protein [Actinomycetota bacterium]